jgi:triacylglycerol lipase
MTKKKDLPPPSAELLFHPERDTEYQYFEDSTKNPFDPAAQRFSRVNAWWLADAALLAYSGQQKMREVYDRLRLQSEFLQGGSTQCHLAWNERFVIVAFRGTQPDEWQDLFDDGHFTQDTWPTGHVHVGFKTALGRVMDELEPKLKGLGDPRVGRTIWFTGHSLGAALATLAADHFDFARNSWVYTVGSPRVGNYAFATAFDRRFRGRAFRHMNDTDIVTRVPPPLLLIPPLVYRHVDALRFIAADGTISGLRFSIGNFLSEVVRDLKRLREIVDGLINERLTVLPAFLVDHTPRRYAVHMWNDLVDKGA